MTRSLQETFGIIQRTLHEEGFQLVPSCCITYQQSSFFLGNENYKEDGMLNGYDLAVEVVHTHNSVEQEVNYRLSMMEWKYSSGHSVMTVKILGSQTEKTIVKKVKKFADDYKRYLGDKQK